MSQQPLDWVKLEISKEEEGYLSYKQELSKYSFSTSSYIAFSLPILYSQIGLGKITKEKFDQKVISLEEQLEFHLQKSKTNFEKFIYSKLLIDLNNFKQKIKMKEIDKIEDRESRVLGAKVDAPKTYTPECLERELRQHNRTIYGLDSENLPFTGYDSWNIYEASFLNKNSLPIHTLVKVSYPSDSKYIVESKSLKFYINGFAGTPSSSVDVHETLYRYIEIIKKDLSKLLETNVDVHIFNPFEEHKPSKLFSDYNLLEKSLTIVESPSSLKFTEFKENPLILQGTKTPFKTNEIKVHSALLRSNCKITHQCDNGDIFIYMKSNYQIDQVSLLKYIVSFREENHFHEEICECVYKRLWDIFNPQELMVTCLYARRGGIDINPIRVSDVKLLETNLISPRIYCEKTFKQ